MATGNPRPENDEILSRLRECLCVRPEVVMAYLFGSVARGDDRADSDIDVAVLIDIDHCAQGDDPYGYRAALLGDLLTCLNRNDVDLVLLNDAPGVLSHRVLRDGRLILCRDENRRVQFTERVIRDYCDTAHLRALRAQYLELSILDGTFGKVVPYRTVIGQEGK